MNYTLKFPNWRKASVAAAHHVTAFFSRWRCCSCLPFFCPSDCHHEWHFMHSWTTLSKGLCIHLLQIFDVKFGRSREENQQVQQIHKQNNTEKKSLTGLKKGEAFLLSYLHQCILTLDVLLDIITIWIPQHFMQVCLPQHGEHKQYSESDFGAASVPGSQQPSEKAYPLACWNELDVDYTLLL